MNRELSFNVQYICNVMYGVEHTVLTYYIFNEGACYLIIGCVCVYGLITVFSLQ